MTATASPRVERNGARAPRPARAAPFAIRRPPWVAVGVLLIVGGALLFAILGRPSADRRAVLVAAHALAPGDVVAATDLRVVELSTEDVIATIDASDRSAVLGQRVRVPIADGSLLHRDLLSADGLLSPGEVVVGAALVPGEIPTAALRPGDRVRALDVAETSGAPVADATVYGATPLTGQGGLFVSLAVAEDDAAALAEAAAGGRLRLVLLGAGR